MKKFFYDVCFKHNMLRQTAGKIVKDTRWVEFDTSDLVLGENIDPAKNEVYYLVEAECTLCIHPPDK